MPLIIRGFPEKSTRGLTSSRNLCLQYPIAHDHGGNMTETPNTIFPGRPHYVGPISGWFGLLHHDKLCEQSHDVMERVDYVRREKSQHEIETRLHNMIYLGDIGIAYNAAVKPARDAYDAAVKPARDAYHAAVKPARDAYHAAVKP